MKTIENVQDKTHEMIGISEEILRNLEQETTSLIDILPKCKKLARLRNDFDALNCFSLELNGYDKQSLPPGIKEEDLPKYAKITGRDIIEKDSLGKEKMLYWTWSIAEIETLIKNKQQHFEDLKLPQQFSPTITHQKASDTGFFAGMESEHVHETFRDVVSRINQDKTTLSNDVRAYKGVLTRIRNRIHDYVLKINYELQFENITDNIFQNTRKIVEEKLAKVCPDAIREFIAVFDRLRTPNPTEWSQAMSSCRRVLKEFADSVFPPRNEPFEDSSGKKRDVKDDNVRNRLWAHIDQTCSSRSKKAFLIAKTEDLGHRVDTLYDLTSKGMKVDIDKLDKFDIEMCVMEIFLLLGYILNLKS